jgi:hypothetical protein
VLASVMAGLGERVLGQMTERVPLIKRAMVLPPSEVAMQRDVRRELRPITVWQQRQVMVPADATAFILHELRVMALGVRMRDLYGEPFAYQFTQGGLVMTRDDILEVRVLRDPRSAMFADPLHVELPR